MLYGSRHITTANGVNPLLANISVISSSALKFTSVASPVNKYSFMLNSSTYTVTAMQTYNAGDLNISLISVDIFFISCS